MPQADTTSNEMLLTLFESIFAIIAILWINCSIILCQNVYLKPL